MRGMGDFGVKLKAVEADGFVTHGGEWTGGRVGEGDKVAIESHDLIAMTHPDGGHGRDTGEEPLAIGDGQPCRAVFAGFPLIDIAAEDLAGELHAVADAEDGDFEIEDLIAAAWGPGFRHAGRPAGEDNPLGIDGFQVIQGDIRCHKHAEGPRLPDPAGDELGVLAAKIENGNNFSMRRGLDALNGIPRHVAPGGDNR